MSRISTRLIPLIRLHRRLSMHFCNFLICIVQWRASLWPSRDLPRLSTFKWAICMDCHPELQKLVQGYSSFFAIGPFVTLDHRSLRDWDNLRLIHTSADSAVDSCISTDRYKNFYLCIDTVYWGNADSCDECESTLIDSPVFATLVAVS